MRGFPDDERAAYKGTVRNNVLDIVEVLACIAEDEYAGLDDTAKVHATLLSRELAKWETQPKKLTWEVAKAVKGLWQNELLKSKLFDANEVYSSKSAP
jgi:guanine nucleotide-binding protein G(i) subunit alpha